MIFDFDFSELDNEKEFLSSNLDKDLVIKNIPTYTSEKLCDMIVCDRYIGFAREISTICMQELAKRRMNGEVFDFEDYIEKSYNELPQLNIDVSSLNSILNTFKK